MSTGRRSRKAKSAASDMFKRFARGEDLLVESASKFSYNVGQKQVKEQPGRKKPQSTPGTPERNTLSTTDKGVSKCDPSTKTKPQSDDSGNKDVSTTRLKKQTKTVVKLKVIPQVDTDMQLPKSGKSREVRKGLSNETQIVVIHKRKTLPEVATKPSPRRGDGDEGVPPKDSSTAEEQCKAEIDPPRRDNMRTKCSTTTEKVVPPLTPKKHTEDNLWSHNKNFSLSPRVKVVSPLPTSERPAEGVYTVSVLTNLAQTEAKVDIKKEPVSPNPGNQTVVPSPQQRERRSSPVAAISKCASPIQRISARGAAKKSHANPISDVKCLPSEKTHRAVVKESATKCDGDSFTKIKLVKVKPHTCSRRRPSSPLPYPSESFTQEKFFHMFNLVKKSVLLKDVSITNKLHREAGGKLRRVIKPCMKPEMVYRRLELARGCIIQGMHEKFEALNEWKSKPGGLQDTTRVFMYDERRKRHEILADNKIALLAAAIPAAHKSKPAMKAGSGRSSPAADVGLTTKDLKDTSIVKSARKLCFDGLVESPTHGPMQYLKPKVKKRKHLVFDDSSDAAKTRRAESPSCHVSAENLSKKVMESQKKDKEAAKPVDAAISPVPSRRSARQQGGKRKMWCHLLRAAPDEYIVDQQWETEQQKKEEKRRAKLWRNTGDASAETSQENSSNEDDVSSSRHSTTSDLPVESDAAQRSETPTEDSAVSSPLAKKIKIEPDDDVALIDESAIKVKPTDVVKDKKKKRKKKKLALVDDDTSVPENIIGPDGGHPPPENKCVMLLDQLKPIFSDTANDSSKISDDANFAQNNNKESLECNEMLPYVFSSSAGASPSGTWPVAHGERYHYADYECTIPHMCMVCWINDHMYCKNMKRVARDLPPCGGCIHYIPCKHYRYLKDVLNYSRKKITKTAPTIDKSASATLNCGDVKVSPTDLHKAQLSAEDLLCYEEMLESDSEPSSPDTPAGTEILKAHLKARASQIAKSLGVKRLSSLNSVVSEVMIAPAEDKSDSERGEAVDICEFGAEVILLSDNGFNYTRVHEHMLTGVPPQNVPVCRSVRVDSASKALKEVGSKSIDSAVKDIKMPGKFCIRVAHQGGGVKPGVAADGQKVIKVKVQRIEPKKLLLQATPSGGEADDGKISLDVVPEEREICLPANKRGDADFDSDLLGGIIAQEAMKLVSSGNFRPQLLKLTFDGDAALPFSRVDDKKEPGMSEKGKSKKKARKRQRDENVGLEEMQRNLNLVGEPRVSWSIESLPEELDKEELVDTTKWPSPTSRMAQAQAQSNQKERLTPCEHAPVVDTPVGKHTTGNERPLDLHQKQTDSPTLVAPTHTAVALRNKKPDCKKQREFVEPGVNNMIQKMGHQSKKPAETHQSKSHKEQTGQTCSVPADECETKTQEQELPHPRCHDHPHVEKKHEDRTGHVNSRLDKPHVKTTDTVHPQLSGDTSVVTTSDDTSVVSRVVSGDDSGIKTSTDDTTAMECDMIPLGHVVINVNSDINTAINSADTGERGTSTTRRDISSVDNRTVIRYARAARNTVHQDVNNADSDISVVTSSACAVQSDTVVVDRVVSTFESDIGSFDGGIASYDSAVSSADCNADHADSCVTSVINTTAGGDSDDMTPDSGVYLCDDVTGEATNKPVTDTHEPTYVMSSTSINSSIQDNATETSDGDTLVVDTPVTPPVNQMSLEEFLESMTLAGVPADEINALRQQMTSLADNEVIELVTPSPQEVVSDQMSTPSHVEQENPSTPSSIADHQLDNSQESHDEVPSESIVVTHEDIQTVGSEIETNTSIVEGQADDLGPFIICDGQIVHYNAQTGVMMAVEGAALEEVPQTVIDDTANIEYSTEESYVYTSDGLCQSVESSTVDEYDIAQIASQPLA